MAKIEYKPEGWPAVVPRIFADAPDELVDFIKHVFDATGSFHATRPSELHIGNAMIMISGTTEREPTSAYLYVYVPDADRSHRRAVERGALSIEDPRDLPYGDRRAMVRDRWGNIWQIATHRGRFTP
jgi:uncharacterized glyoxalase superfamily protein PhnB